MLKLHHIDEIHFAIAILALDKARLKLVYFCEILTMSIVQEHRAAARRRVLYAGEIISADGDYATCVIRSLSANGARLRVSTPAPAAFDLRITRDGSICHARIVWRRDDECGVVFGGDEANGSSGASVENLCSSLRLSRIGRTTQ